MSGDLRNTEILRHNNTTRDVTSRSPGENRRSSDKLNGDVVHSQDTTSYSLSSADFSHPYPYR